MPPVRTTKSHVDSDANSKKKRPSIRKMFVSVSRVKPYTGPNWNFQSRLGHYGEKHLEDAKRIDFSSLDFEMLKADIEIEFTDLKYGDETWCLVWRMSISGQLGRVYDDESFQSAVEDHRRAYKSIVQLYIIRSEDALEGSEF